MTLTSWLLTRHGGVEIRTTQHKSSIVVIRTLVITMPKINLIPVLICVSNYTGSSLAYWMKLNVCQD